eukprot:11395281-Karenia_brevis.AAC.1
MEPQPHEGDRVAPPEPVQPKARPRSQTPLERLKPKPETTEERRARLRKRLDEITARREARLLDLPAS